ncbi:hypothetical protein ACFV2H_52400 [Streptomyces sp. NPDC059629]|uniref:hypothetical protein n=1 Tax=Streptomyces sp. NPDC059629 TaxID=3346889 RepID=UPI0036A5821F
MRVAITGHRGLSKQVEEQVRALLADQVNRYDPAEPVSVSCIADGPDQQVVALLTGEPVHRGDQHLVSAALLSAGRCDVARDLARPARGGRRTRLLLGVTTAVGPLRAALAVPGRRGPALCGTSGVVAARRLRALVGAAAGTQAQRQRGGDGGQSGGDGGQSGQTGGTGGLRCAVCSGHG